MSSVSQYRLFQYNIDTNNFTDHGGDYLWSNLGNVYGELGGGCFYTQINETMLFTIRQTGDYIHAYDLHSLSYQALPSRIPINVANEAGGACLASSKSPKPQLFVVGGPAYSPEGWPMLNTLQILDLSDGNWSFGPNMTFGRAWHGCVVVNDWLWAIGWSMAMEAIYVPELSKSSSDINSWSISGYLPVEFLWLHRIAVFEDMIFVVGGCQFGDVCPSDTVWIIDTNDWNGDLETLELPYAMALMSIVVIDRTVYGFGGVGESQNDSQSLPHLDSWWKYEMLSTASIEDCTHCLLDGYSDFECKTEPSNGRRILLMSSLFSKRTFLFLYWVLSL